MKVVTAKAMADLEALAYQEGYSEDTFMENAGKNIALFIEKLVEDRNLHKHILLLCGKGNNGGDAFVAGSFLTLAGFSVSALCLEPIDTCSLLCKKNRQRFTNQGGIMIPEIIEDFSSYSVIVDGLFGTGFKGDVREPYSLLIQLVNQSKRIILSIDIPSGLNGTTGETSKSTIVATETLALGLPKIGFFLRNGWNYVGKLNILPFGLPKHLVDKFPSHVELLTESYVSTLVPPIRRNRNKYEAGEVIGLSGSPGMPGAALLASLAALRGGCGMVRLLHPQGMESELSDSPYELIKIPYSYQDEDKIASIINHGRSTFIGPALGRGPEVTDFLQHIMPLIQRPCVLDADALFHYANKSFVLPKDTIFTPHTGEMQHLLHLSAKLQLTEHTLALCQQYAEEHQITLILKGAPTFIFQAGKQVFVNPTGDPGMATAGSGDVLTGLLAALVAQGLNNHQAALLGVYLHGLAGEYAADNKTSYSLIASDIINNFPQAWKQLKSSNS